MYHKPFAEVLGSGAPVVMLHGWAMSGRVWRALAESLAEEYAVWLIDLPGHGRSTWPDGAAPGWIFEGTVAIAPEDAVWIGWSLGGSLAIAATLQARKRVRGVVVVAGTPRFVADAEWSAAMPLERFERFAADIANDYVAAMQRFITLQLWGMPNARDLVRHLTLVLGQTKPDSNGLSAGLNWLRESDLRTGIAELDIPLQFILGRRDVLVPIALADALAELAPEAEVEVIDTAAHMPFLTHSREVLELIKTFLRRTTGTSP